MNTKIAIVTIAAAAAFSSPAFAGELYGSAERNLNTVAAAVSTMQPFETSLAVSGALYPEAYAAIDNAVASSAPREAYVTTLAVGGELGYPSGGSNYRSMISKGALAE